MNEFEIEFEIKPNEFEIEMDFAIQEVYPELEDLEVTPSKEEQNFKSKKYGYDNVVVKAVEGEELDVIPSKEKQNFKGLYDEVIVNEVTSNIDENIKAENIKAGINILGINGSFEGIDTSDATATADDILHSKTAYINNEKITGTIQEYDGSYSGNTSSVNELKITDTSNLFDDNTRLDSLQEMLKFCKDVTTMEYMFKGSTKLTEVDFSNFDASKVTNMYGVFYGCTGLTKLNLSGFNAQNVTTVENMFRSCKALTFLDFSNCDFGKITNIYNMFYGCSGLTEIKSFRNLGKGYVQQTENFSQYTLSLENSSKLAIESLIDIITNGLYDLNLTYDVANGGTLYRQKLSLANTSLAKLQATEEGLQALAQADRKGWNVS